MVTMVATRERLGISKDELSLKAGCFGAEPWSDGMRRQLEQDLGIKAHDIYGSLMGQDSGRFM